MDRGTIAQWSSLTIERRLSALDNGAPSASPDEYRQLANELRDRQLEAGPCVARVA